jgi:hypothetical protein
MPIPMLAVADIVRFLIIIFICFALHLKNAWLVMRLRCGMRGPRGHDSGPPVRNSGMPPDAVVNSSAGQHKEYWHTRKTRYIEYLSLALLYGGRYLRLSCIWQQPGPWSRPFP